MMLLLSGCAACYMLLLSAFLLCVLELFGMMLVLSFAFSMVCFDAVRIPAMHGQPEDCNTPGIVIESP